MSARWFRVYDDLVNDPKVQRLPDKLFKGLINLWCIASSRGGVLPAAEDIAFVLRQPLSSVTSMLAALAAAGLIDDDGTGMRPHNWNGRQFKSDVSTDRVKQHRERKRNAGSNDDETLHETPPETETETEKKTPSLRSGAKRATRLAEDWQPSAVDREFAAKQGLSEADTAREADKFRDFWIAKPGKDGTKLEWAATWRSWVRRACEMRGISPAANGKDATDDDWRKRLGFARRERKWAKSRWGPMPNEPGCLVPPGLIELTDGTGWAEWGEGH